MAVITLSVLMEISALRMSRDDFLAAAPAADEAASAKCMVLMDAINEGDGYLLWA